MRLGRRSCALAGMAAFLAGLVPSAAQQTPLPLKWENYTAADGMPDSKVLSVAVDGARVWAGTRNGLVQIEGGRIRKVFTLEDGLANQVVTAIAVDRNTGYLWIATFGGLSRYSGGHFQNYTSLSTGLANDIVHDVAVQGRYVWAATAAGISRLDTHTGEWAIFSENNAPLSSSQAVGIAVGNRKVYFAIWGGGVMKYDDTSLHWSSAGGESRGGQRPVHEIASSLAYDGVTGTLWIGTPFGVRGFDGQNRRDFVAESSGLASNFINAVRTHDSGLWSCTDQGLSYLDLKTGTWVTYRAGGRSGNGVIAIMGPDRKVVKQDVTTSLAHSQVLNVAFQGSDIWVATGGGLSHGMQSSSPQPEPLHRAAPVPEHANFGIRESPAVNIGFFGPLENTPDSPFGLAMLHGAQLAIEEANARGGYRSSASEAPRPYALMAHNDSAQWGASTTELTKMVMHEQVVAALGPIDPASARVMLRASLTLELPIVYTGAADPTITEVHAPWVLRTFPDDRQQSRALSDYVFAQLQLKRVGVIRSPNRVARSGAQAFLLEAQRAGRTPVLEVESQLGASDYSVELQRLRDAKIDGLMIWLEPAEAAHLLRQMRAMGMQKPVFGWSRLASGELIAGAGPAAEGLVSTCVLDPTRGDPKWRAFERDYRRRFDVAPDAYASYAFDGMQMLTAAIEKAGINRARVMEALRELQNGGYEGASGRIQLDRTLNNISPIAMARVEGGRFVYWSSSQRARRAE